MTTERKSSASSHTLCWSCSHSYSVGDAACPQCNAANANVDPDKAQAQCARSEIGATQDQRAADALATAGELGGAGAPALNPSEIRMNHATMPANPSQDVHPAAHPLNIPALTVGPVEFTEKQMDALISHMNCDLTPLEKIHQDALRNYKGPLPMPAAHPLPTPRADAAWFEAVKCGASGDEWQHVVSADFARTLEREAAELRAHLDRLTGMKFSDRMHAALVSRAETAERQRDEALKDAERYRWLRSDDRAIALIAEKGKRRSPASLLDAAIDAAKEKSNGK